MTVSPGLSSLLVAAAGVGVAAATTITTTTTIIGKQIRDLALNIISAVFPMKLFCDKLC